MPGLTRGANRVKKVWAGTLPDHAIAVAWSRDGRALAAASSGGPVMIFDARAGTGDGTLTGHAGGTLALAWSPAADLLATAGKDGRVRLWDASGREVAALEAGAAWAEWLAWHPSGALLAAAAGRTVRVWDAAGSLVADLPDHPSTVSDLAWRPNTDTLAALVYGGVQLWTMRASQPPASRLFPWKGSPLRMAWSPNGVMLAHGNQDSTVHFWYAETAEELQMSGYERKVRELSWDPTSRYLATGGGPAVCVWDCGGAGPRDSTPLMLGGGDEGASLTAVAFQGRGQLLASADTRGRVRVWQPQNKKQPLVGVADGDGSAVSALAWSPDDRLLASGFASGAVCVASVS